MSRVVIPSKGSVREQNAVLLHPRDLHSFPSLEGSLSVLCTPPSCWLKLWENEATKESIKQTICAFCHMTSNTIPKGGEREMPEPPEKFLIFVLFTFYCPNLSQWKKSEGFYDRGCACPCSP